MYPREGGMNAHKRPFKKHFETGNIERPKI